VTRRPTQEITPGRIRFLHEQDGEVERTVKAHMVRLFEQHGRVARAYLAHVDYGDPDAYDVALCVATVDGREDRALVESIADVFARLFGPDEHLDTLFLSPERERQLTAVCRPFFVRTLDA
jgi:hypothetical protein